jgi:hypothetical protein
METSHALRLNGESQISPRPMPNSAAERRVADAERRSARQARNPQAIKTSIGTLKFFLQSLH